jgi:hypothetical protein
MTLNYDELLELDSEEYPSGEKNNGKAYLEELLAFESQKEQPNNDKIIRIIKYLFI